ncbi:hypothetical protein PAI11_18550 [Patulibacter medicamentivorans]|uniref:Uncharacterized protein n=1 Tax=Patulibacter medicamentivorans TaxID=1097667 RepID=H0E4X0_9ACTN|nr:hypothetical protein PAI11_18550 [Patulibacter medicamentivorans]
MTGGGVHESTDGTAAEPGVAQEPWQPRPNVAENGGGGIAVVAPTSS